MNTLKSEKQKQVLAALVEGNSIRATCRMTGTAKGTVLKLFLRDVLRDVDQNHQMFSSRSSFRIAVEMADAPIPKYRSLPPSNPTS